MAPLLNRPADRRRARVWLALTLAFCACGWAQSTLPVKWEELTSGDFAAAMERAQGVCVLPFGVVEKHGQHLPLGTDLFNVRYVAVSGARQEYAIVFPEYYFGQIFEARHEPGTIAYSTRLQLELLQETTAEMARNGCKKILIENGHGGNNNLLPYFAQSQLDQPRDYVVYIHSGQMQRTAAGRPPVKDNLDGHGAESETSRVMVSRPELVRLERSGAESGANLNRLDLPAGVFTGISWYSRYPNHYAGNAAAANAALGDFDMKAASGRLAAVLRAIKADQMSLKLQREFYEKAQRPLETKP